MRSARAPGYRDAVLITLRIEWGVIEEVTFKCLGCPPLLPFVPGDERGLGKSLDEAFKVRSRRLPCFGGIPGVKTKGSNSADSKTGSREASSEVPSLAGQFRAFLLFRRTSQFYDVTAV